MLALALRKLKLKRDFEFRVICGFEYTMDGVDLKVVPFNRAREVEDLHALDIGVYPLPNEHCVFGKSGLKAIVYMAMGLPMVSSCVGMTPLLYSHGEIGFMVDSEDEWVEARTRLIDNELLRKRMGETARRVAIENYSRQAGKTQYLEVLNAVL
jgi:L-malate glycosyltransferase